MIQIVMKVYLAGGAVRDLLLGNPIIERDYLVTDITAREFQHRFPNARRVGKAFPIFLLDRQEFSFPRANSLVEELELRDLTVNALLLDENGHLICHPSGLDDLRTRTLRPASGQAFFEDPLRVYRAARFWSRYPDFTPHADLLDTMHEVARADLLKQLPADRVGQETRKAFNTSNPGNFIKILAQTNSLTPWFSPLKDHLMLSNKTSHSSSLISFCELLDRLSGNEIHVWMGLCSHATRMRSSGQHLASDYNNMARTMARTLRLPNSFARAGEIFNAWHQDACDYPEMPSDMKVDLLLDLHQSRLMDSFFRVLQVKYDRDYKDLAHTHLSAMLRVKLPESFADNGPEAGRRLRELRAIIIQKA